MSADGLHNQNELEALRAENDRLRAALSKVKAQELQRPSIDVLVLAARVEEQEALAEEFSKVADDNSTKELIKRLQAYDLRNKAYCVKNVDQDSDHDNNFISVAIIECAEMGNVSSAIHTAHGIRIFQPSLAIFSGIAGSMNAQEIRIGDVIFPRRVKTRWFQKMKSVKTTRKTAQDIIQTFNVELESTLRDGSVLGPARDLLTKIPRGLEAQLQNAPIPQEWVTQHNVPARNCTVLKEESSFCWGKVLSSKEYCDYLRPILGNDATMVDMESWGFLRAIEVMRNQDYATSGIVVRSASDFAEFKELTKPDPQWRTLAMRNMAIATRHVVQTTFSKVFR